MKLGYLTVISPVLLLLVLANTAYAADGGVLFKKYNCVMCHAPSSKTLGPSLKAMAIKYVDDKQVASILEQKIRNGGSGSFGEMPMPATPKSVSDTDIKTMVEWILEYN